MKKMIALLIICLMAATLIAGCNKAPDPIVNPSTGPNMQQPDVTIPATTETLPDDSFGTSDGTGATAPDVTEPEATTPVATTPAPTTPKATEPTPTTPKPTEPVATTPKPTEPVATTPKATTPGHTHSYTGKVTKEATCTAAGTKTFTCSCGDVYTETIKATGHNYTTKVTKQATCTTAGTKTSTCSACGNTTTETIKATGHNYTTKVVAPTTSAQGYTLYTCSGCGESYKDNYTDKLPTESESSDPIAGVTPDNISVSNTAGWTKNDWDTFVRKYGSSMTNAQKRAYYIAYYDGYDCGVAGHDCKNSQEHVRFTRPCQYCGLTLGCVGRICTDELGFTYCDNTKCYSYDVKLDPSKYCQTCGKPTSPSLQSDPTKRCTKTISDGKCGVCGQAVKGHTCHTCKQEDIDAYN